MIKLFVLPHLGLGDQLIMSGMIKMWEKCIPSSLLSDIQLVVKEPSLETVRDLYADCPHVTFRIVHDDSEISPLSPHHYSFYTRLHQQGYQMCFFGCHTGSPQWRTLDPCWANCFYLQRGLSPSIRFSGWSIPYTDDLIQRIQTTTQSFFLYLHLPETDWKYKYIIVHDDPSRHLVLSLPKVFQYIKLHHCESFPVFFFGSAGQWPGSIRNVNGSISIITDKKKKEEEDPDYSKWIQTQCVYVSTHLSSPSSSLLEWVRVLMYAKQLHMMDSSPALLSDMSLSSLHPGTHLQIRYLHQYVRNQPVNGLYHHPWTIVS